MNNDVKQMLKKVMIIDVILGLILSTMGQCLFKSFFNVILIGFITGIITFLLNSIISSFILNKTTDNYKLYFILCYILRVGLVILVGILLAKQSRFYVMPYVIGYSAHLISLVIYGLTIKK